MKEHGASAAHIHAKNARLNLQGRQQGLLWNAWPETQAPQSPDTSALDPSFLCYVVFTVGIGSQDNHHRIDQAL